MHRSRSIESPYILRCISRTPCNDGGYRYICVCWQYDHVHCNLFIACSFWSSSGMFNSWTSQDRENTIVANICTYTKALTRKRVWLGWISCTCPRLAILYVSRLDNQLRWEPFCTKANIGIGVLGVATFGLPPVGSIPCTHS